MRERDISSVCYFIMGALDGAARQKAFPQDYFGFASLGASVLTTLTHYSGKRSAAQCPSACLAHILAVQSSDSQAH